MTVAIVPAAGHSSRMGRPKLALPLAGRSVLEHVVAALRAGGCSEVVVVIGPHVPELEPLATAAGARVIKLSEPTPDMRATVERGLAGVEELLHPAPDDPWLLVPADHPTLDVAVVRRLLAEYRASERSIAIPTVNGRRGHPTVCAWKLASSIRSLPPGQGLNAFFRTLANETIEVPFAEESVLCDMDTPEEFARLQRAFDRQAAEGERPT